MDSKRRNEGPQSEGEDQQQENTLSVIGEPAPFHTSGNIGGGDGFEWSEEKNPSPFPGGLFPKMG